MIANTIIKRALRRLLVTQVGGTPTTQQYADGLEVLNDIVNSWSANGDLIYEDTLEEIAVAANEQNFTIGATGDKATVRPLSIKTATLRDANNYEFGLEEADAVKYANFNLKTTQSLPNWYYYRNTFPNGTWYFDFATDKAYTLVLTSMKALSTFPDGTTDVALPAHYEKALKSNLLIDLAPEMGAAKRITQDMRDAAKEDKATIIGQALDIIPSTTELSRPSSYNIHGDTY